jgi:hypothetical protein
MGEATGLISRVDLSSYRCSCGRLFLECEFWAFLATRTRELGHPVDVFQTGFWNTHPRVSRSRLINALLVRSLRWDPINQLRDALLWRVGRIRGAIMEAGWNTWGLAAAVLERTGKAVFVDTARDHQRPKYLVGHPLLDVRVIHLVRDPRGNTASIIKHTGTDVATAARRWRRYNTEAARIRRYLPEHSWMSLHYESLCADPGGTLDRISDFLEIERAPLIGAAGEPEHHIIGNKMRMQRIREVREDLSWQTRFNRSELATIARVAGPLSHRLGYTWP